MLQSKNSAATLRKGWQMFYLFRSCSIITADVRRLSYHATALFFGDKLFLHLQSSETSTMKNSIPFQSDNKIAVSFKCSLSLRSTLCSQADKLGVTLSSYIEAKLSSQEEDQEERNDIAIQLQALKEKVAITENSLLEVGRQAAKDKEAYKKTAARFIMEVSEGDKEPIIPY